MTMGLTPRQSGCLRFISDYIRQNAGVAPSYPEIEQAIGVSSRSEVSRLIGGLEERGYIRRLKHQSRAIEVLHPLPGEEPPSLPSRLARLTDEAFQRTARAVLAEGQRRAGGRA